MLEEATLKLRQLEAEFQQQQGLETEAKTGTDLRTAAKETSQEAGHEATERPGEQAQVRLLKAWPTSSFVDSHRCGP
jgi:hypothetical protein